VNDGIRGAGLLAPLLNPGPARLVETEGTLVDNGTKTRLVDTDSRIGGG